jgi:hypothetical protein
MKKDWDATLPFLVALEPKFRHECSQTTSDKLIGDVDGGTDCGARRGSGSHLGRMFSCQVWKKGT